MQRLETCPLSVIAAASCSCMFNKANSDYANATARKNTHTFFLDEQLHMFSTHLGLISQGARDETKGSGDLVATQLPVGNNTLSICMMRLVNI